ncbi:MAG TPA: hypothetical protein VGR59_03060, partial [Gemmatimonadaceae bacterium]|nr:hypothetical protein [Gemmatimonadaceae bacterium]
MTRRHHSYRMHLAASLLAAAAPSLHAQHTPPAAAARWWHDITVIADDSMHGQRTGTADYLEAAHYVASQFQSAGLAPGGTDGYFQTVHLAEARVAPESSSVVLESGGASD